MHACIAALSQCVPAVGLAYSNKFSGVYSSIGMEQFVVDLRERDTISLIEIVDDLYHQRKFFRAKLEARIPSVCPTILELFSDLSTQFTG